jgi:hypothetical protein
VNFRAFFGNKPERGKTIDLATKERKERKAAEPQPKRMENGGSKRGDKKAS